VLSKLKKKGLNSKVPDKFEISLPGGKPGVIFFELSSSGA
jgi:hypothetical protein